MADLNHREMAISLFNQTWEFLERVRSVEEDYQMILTAHASCYHWSQAGTPLEQARGEWLISRVHSVLGQGEIALWHATRSLRLCRENGYGGFDLAFALEALARAKFILGDVAAMDALIEAKQTAEMIEDKDDREYTLKEIESTLSLWEGKSDRHI